MRITRLLSDLRTRLQGACVSSKKFFGETKTKSVTSSSDADATSVMPVTANVIRFGAVAGCGQVACCFGGLTLQGQLFVTPSCRTEAPFNSKESLDPRVVIRQRKKTAENPNAAITRVPVGSSPVGHDPEVMSASAVQDDLFQTNECQPLSAVVPFNSGVRE
jgi:hypothetical protein